MSLLINTLRRQRDEIEKLKKYALLCAALWTVLLSGLFIAYVVDTRQTILEIGHSVAQASFEKDVLFRRWAARHGGVYVPITATTPVNPYLADIPDRDITTPSGKHLTLMNPAYMSRQIFELAHEKSDLAQGHITSLNPIRPENAPDAWETQALQALERGAKGVDELVQVNGQTFLRYMRPLVTEKPCLRCHASQGYREGDGRGGISVTLSLAPIQKAMNTEILQEGFIHAFIWLLGLAFIWFVTRKFVRTLTSLRDERNKLSESEEQLRVIFETSESGIILVSPQGCIDFANERMAEMFGMTLQALIGTFYSDHLHESEKLAGGQRMRQLIQGEIESVSFDRRYIRTDGSNFWGHLSGRRLKNPDGTLRGLVGLISDISESRQAEEERILLEEKFHHAQKMESLGVLAGGIAHDFNNILTVILGHCFMGMEGCDQERSCKSHFQQIESASNRAADLCRQMLTYAGKSPLVQTPVNLWLLVDDVVKMLQSAIKKNVTIELELNQRVPEIKGDAGQIQQIVMNLIINAAEAIGDANGSIKVALSVAEFAAARTDTDTFGTLIPPGRYACLEVADTGSGMDEDTQKRIFEPFYTTKFAGRGLGMSAIRGIVTSHEGLLHLNSTPGVGTTFKVCFPLAEAPFAATALFSTTPAPAEMKSATVLLVDDEQALRDMGTTLLETMGFSVLTAQHGGEALEIYRECASEIDVILLDLIMPVMGGEETFHELRKRAPAIPIIICSGYSAESVDDLITSDPHAGFVHKPYKPDELRNMLLRMKR